jgi:hypothetical protein
MLGIENENPENKELFQSSSNKKTELQVPYIKTINTTPSKIMSLTTLDADHLVGVTEDGFIKIFSIKVGKYYFPRL